MRAFLFRDRKMDLEAFQKFLIENGARWVESQRDLHGPTAEPLPESLKAVFQRYFEPETLETSRIKIVPRIENPDFYSRYADRNLTKLLDFGAMMAMAFDNVILLSQEHLPPEDQRTPLLFHELVHVVQYKVLGVRAFLERYVRGWVESGFHYFFIPIESQAYELQGRFLSEPERPFSVLSEVRRQLEIEG